MEHSSVFNREIAAVEYKAKDGSTEIMPLFPQSEIQIVRFMLGNAMVELHNNQLADGSKTVDVFIRQNQECKNVASPNMVPSVVDVESPAQPGNEIDPELATKNEEAINEFIEMNEEIREHTSNEIDSELAAKKEEAIKKFNEMKEKRRKHKEQYSSILLVLVSVYIALTYQAGMSPPGGLWQDDQKNLSSSSNTAIFAGHGSMSNVTNIPSNNTSTPSSETYAGPDHTAGNSILQDKDGAKFNRFYYANSVAFSCSLLTIVILLSETYASSDMLAVEAVKFLILSATVCIGIAFTVGSAYRHAPDVNLITLGFICWYIPFLIYDYIHQKIRYKKMQQACE